MFYTLLFEHHGYFFEKNKGFEYLRHSSLFGCTYLKVVPLTKIVNDSGISDSHNSLWFGPWPSMGVVWKMGGTSEGLCERSLQQKLSRAMNSSRSL